MKKTYKKHYRCFISILLPATSNR